MTAHKTTKIAWVTGASTGMGAAISLDLARDGWTVIATARTTEKLERLASLSSELDGQIIAMPADVTDRSALKAIVDKIETDIGPLHLAILNAGTYTPEDLTTFKAEHFKTQIALNLNAIADCAEFILPYMLGRKRGHIAFVSSVAGYRGLPNSLGYGASKAGLINMAEAFAIMGKAHGLKVQVINPGFVRTPLTDKNDFKMPFLMDVNEASKRIMLGLRSNRFEITFPKRFSYLLKTLGLLPDRLYFFLMRFALKK